MTTQSMTVPSVSPPQAAGPWYSLTGYTLGAFDPVNYIISFLVSVLVVMVAMLVAPATRHWAVFPLVVMGCLVGSDAAAWFRGKMDVFDPKAVMGVFGFHFFVIAPLIFMNMEHWHDYIRFQPHDWSKWVGWITVLNILGWLAYKVAQHIGQSGTSRRKTIWLPSPTRTPQVLGLALLISLIGEIIWLGYAIPAGVLVHDFMAGFGRMRSGMGIPRFLGFALPLLIFFAIVVQAKTRFLTGRPRRLMILSLLVIILPLMVVAGFYGARGILANACLWVIISAHYLWKPISRKGVIVIGVVGFFALWFYSFYKHYGKDIFYKIFTTPLSELAQESGRTQSGVFVGDLSRIPVHAYALFIQTEHPLLYDLRYGKTYLWSFPPMVPRWIWPNKPADSGKVVAGTELFHGKGYYSPRTVRSQLTGRYFYTKSTNAYGIAGEAMLNFGPLGVILAYGVLGWLMGRYRRYLRSLLPGDYRFLIVPYLTILIVQTLLWDMDNYISQTVLRALIPIVTCYLMTAKVPLVQPASAAVGPGRPAV